MEQPARFSICNDHPEIDLVNTINFSSVAAQHQVSNVSVCKICAVIQITAVNGTFFIPRLKIEKVYSVFLTSGNVNDVIIGRDSKAHKNGSQYTGICLSSRGNLLYLRTIR